MVDREAEWFEVQGGRTLRDLDGLGRSRAIAGGSVRCSRGSPQYYKYPNAGPFECNNGAHFRVGSGHHPNRGEGNKGAILTGINVKENGKQ